MMRNACLSLITLILSVFACRAQEPKPGSPFIDSICFHLYTDSLKKEVYNYINVDAKMSNGSWRPLTDKDIRFEASYGRWDGNSLIIDAAFPGKFVEVTATLKTNPALTRSIKIYLKVLPDPPLKQKRN